MIKIFTTNTRGNVEFTLEQLKELLDEAYWEGYRAATPRYSWTWTVPSYTPYVYTTTSAGTTISSNKDACPSCTLQDFTVTTEDCLNSTYDSITTAAQSNI